MFYHLMVIDDRLIQVHIWDLIWFCCDFWYRCELVGLSCDFWYGCELVKLSCDFWYSCELVKLSCDFWYGCELVGLSCEQGWISCVLIARCSNLVCYFQSCSC